MGTITINNFFNLKIYNNSNLSCDEEEFVNSYFQQYFAIF